MILPLLCVSITETAHVGHFILTARLGSYQNESMSAIQREGYKIYAEGSVSTHNRDIQRAFPIVQAVLLPQLNSMRTM